MTKTESEHHTGTGVASARVDLLDARKIQEAPAARARSEARLTPRFLRMIAGSLELAATSPKHPHGWGCSLRISRYIAPMNAERSMSIKRAAGRLNRPLASHPAINISNTRSAICIHGGSEPYIVCAGGAPNNFAPAAIMSTSAIIHLTVFMALSPLGHSHRYQYPRTCRLSIPSADTRAAALPEDRVPPSASA